MSMKLTEDNCACGFHIKQKVGGTIWFKYLLFSTFLMLLPTVSSGDTHTAASCSLSDVTTAYNTASAGDTVSIPAGNCSWSSTFTISKSITLMGAGASSTTITNGGISPIIHVTLSSDVPVRISGIYFDNVTNNGSDRYAIQVTGKSDGSFGLTHIRIDHNTFNKGKKQIFIQGWAYGVIDNNTFLNPDVAVMFAGDDDYAWLRPIEAGTVNAMFIEDNTFMVDNNNGSPNINEFIYHQEGARSVTRYNSFDSHGYTNTFSHFDSHGNFAGNNGYYSGIPSNDGRGQPILEIYNNTFRIYSNYQFIYLRGGSNLIHDNTFTYDTGGSNAINLTEEECWNSGIFSPLRTSWPAEDQINNSFFWNNTLNGPTLTDITKPQTCDPTFIQKDRDYFMHAPQATGGKETYTGRIGGIMTFSSSGANAYYPYTPYTYPHPLRTGLSAPSAPRNLLITN